MKTRHEAGQIIRMLRDIETSKSVTEGVRKHNITEQTYYRWRKKYGGLSVDEARRLKELEKENGRLKRVVADQAMAIDILKEITGKK
jgi:putative transposase